MMGSKDRTPSHSPTARAGLTLLAALSLAATLTACGKRGNLEPPPGATQTQIDRSERVIDRADNAKIEF